jgi:hypothetical protein
METWRFSWGFSHFAFAMHFCSFADWPQWLRGMDFHGQPGKRPNSENGTVADQRHFH